MKGDFIVPLNGLAQGRKEFRWRAGKEFFGHFENSEILDAALDVLASVEKSGRYIGVGCSIAGEVTVACDRCLDELRLPVETGFELDVKFGAGQSQWAGPDAEGEREILWLSESDADLDLGQAVYDYVCLSLPVQRTHGDGGCDPETVKYLNSEDGREPSVKDSSTPFAGLGNLLGKI